MTGGLTDVCGRQRNRSNMYVYNFRAEKLPKKYPTLKPASNRFNTGILEVALKDEYVGETFGDERMARVRRFCSVVSGSEERALTIVSTAAGHQQAHGGAAEPPGPARRHALERLGRAHALRPRPARTFGRLVGLAEPSSRSLVGLQFARVEAERQSNSTKWKQRAAATYRSPEQLARDAEEKIRQEKEAAAAQREAEARAAQVAAMRYVPVARRRQLLNSTSS